MYTKSVLNDKCYIALWFREVPYSTDFMVGISREYF